MGRHYIVEICRIDHPQAERLKQHHKDEGYDVYAFRGSYLLILGGDRVWVSPDTVFRSPGNAVYVFKD